MCLFGQAGRFAHTPCSLPPHTPTPNLPQLESAIEPASLHPLFMRQPPLVRGAWLPTGALPRRPLLVIFPHFFLYLLHAWHSASKDRLLKLPCCAHSLAGLSLCCLRSQPLPA